MKKILLCVFIPCLMQGCAESVRTIDVYKLEKYKGSEVPVCVNYRQKVNLVREGWYDIDACGNENYVPAEYEPIKTSCNTNFVRVVSYSKCLAQLPLPIHLVEKKEKDMTICYDRNNKVELPISYCQKDNIQIMNVY